MDGQMNGQTDRYKHYSSSQSRLVETYKHVNNTYSLVPGSEMPNCKANRSNNFCLSNAMRGQNINLPVCVCLSLCLCVCPSHFL